MSSKKVDFPWLKKISVLGTAVSFAGKEETIDLLSIWLKFGNRRAIMVTANAEILLWAREHPTYQKIINQSLLVTVDGFGVFCALFWFKLLGKIQPSVVSLWRLRFTGRQLLEEICQLAPQKSWRIFLLGGEAENVARKTSEILKERYSTPGNKLQIFSWPGPKDALHETASQWQETKKEINKVRPDFLFIAFGYPKPEEWLAKHAKDLNFGVALGIGGVFYEIVGYRKAAPAWVNRLGLESYWRLATEPQRLTRILPALIKFPLAVVFANT